MALLSKGEVPILEAGPRTWSSRASSPVTSGSSSAPKRGYRDAEFVFLCVPTPAGDGGAADLSVVESVVREIGPVLSPARSS